MTTSPIPWPLALLCGNRYDGVQKLAREYCADAEGAEICGQPFSLANALQKLEIANPMHTNAATTHIFIVNPLTGGSLMSLFSTHPPMAERIERLRNMSRTHSF